MNRFKELTKNTLIITIGRLSTQLITFLLLPLYTALLSTSEYGIVDLLSTLVQLFIPIISLMVDQGTFRYLLSCTDESNKKTIISSSFLLLSLLNLIFIIIYFILMIFIESNYKIWLLLIIVVTAYSNLFLQISRGLKKTTDYAVGSFICSTSIIILNVICLVLLSMGATGMIFSIFVGNCLCCIFLFFKLKIYRYLSFDSFDKKVVKDIVKYSVPLVPNQLSIWIMNSSDKLIVSYFLGTSANGILAISHKFPAIFMTFFNIFLLAWHESGTVHFNDKDKDRFFSDMFDMMLTFFSTICIGIIVVLPLVFNLLINNNYFEAYYNIPIYVIANVFNVVIGILGVVYVATKKTSEIARTTVLSAVLNIIINVLLINKIGLYAASISTFISYLIAMLYRLYDSKKYLSLSFNYRNIILIFVVTIISTIIYYLRNNLISWIFLLIFILIALYLNKAMLKSFLQMFKERKQIK